MVDVADSVPPPRPPTRGRPGAFAGEPCPPPLGLWICDGRGGAALALARGGFGIRLTAAGGSSFDSIQISNLVRAGCQRLRGAGRRERAPRDGGRVRKWLQGRGRRAPQDCAAPRAADARWRRGGRGRDGVGGAAGAAGSPREPQPPKLPPPAQGHHGLEVGAPPPFRTKWTRRVPPSVLIGLMGSRWVGDFTKKEAPSARPVPRAAPRLSADAAAPRAAQQPARLAARRGRRDDRAGRVSRAAAPARGAGRRPAHALANQGDARGVLAPHPAAPRRARTPRRP